MIIGRGLSSAITGINPFSFFNILQPGIIKIISSIRCIKRCAK